MLYQNLANSLEYDLNYNNVHIFLNKFRHPATVVYYLFILLLKYSDNVQNMCTFIE